MLDYTHCSSQAPESPILDLMPSNLVTAHFKKSNSSSPVKAMWSRKSINQTWAPGVVVPTIQCSLQFNIPSDMGPPVLFYYHLTNFFQNHRRYAKSFDADQLKGTARSASDIDGSDCKPLTTIDGKPIYPCGLAANSLFNDTFSNPILLTVPTDTGKSIDNQTYVMNNNSGIAWPSDKDLYGTTKYNWSQVAVPPNWALRFPNNYTDDNHPDLVNDEAFQVWMRLAGLPIFSKLAQRNDTDPMISGTYRVDINDSASFYILSAITLFHKLTLNLDFNVTEYGGTKSILISTRTVMGGKNPFLGIAYVVVGGICVLLGTLFTVTHLIRPRYVLPFPHVSIFN